MKVNGSYNLQGNEFYTTLNMHYKSLILKLQSYYDRALKFRFIVGYTCIEFRFEFVSLLHSKYIFQNNVQVCRMNLELQVSE